MRFSSTTSTKAVMSYGNFKNQRFLDFARNDKDEKKMPDIDSHESSSGIAVDVQQRLNCALP
jgi:hypothetical protein